MSNCDPESTRVAQSVSETKNDCKISTSPHKIRKISTPPPKSETFQPQSKLTAARSKLQELIKNLKLETFQPQSQLTAARSKLQELIKNPKSDSDAKTPELIEDLQVKINFDEYGIRQSGGNRRKFLERRRTENPSCTSASLIRRKPNLTKPG